MLITGTVKVSDAFTVLGNNWDLTSELQFTLSATGVWVFSICCKTSDPKQELTGYKLIFN